MAWLARSLANSLRLDDEHDDDDQNEEDEYEEEGDKDVPSDSPTDAPTSLSHTHQDHQKRNGSRIEIESVEAPSRGVKEDLTEFTETFTRQLWGVANFLAPPPSQSTSPPHSHPPADLWTQSERSDRGDSRDGSLPKQSSDLISGSGRDAADMSAKLQTIKSDSEIAEEDHGVEFEQDEEWDYGDAVGVTDEVLVFARNIAMHPETWLDFPLDPEDDLDELKMSVSQQKHTLAVEQLSPRLRALRIELCPCHMTESYFWKVYFVLLHSRLDKHDAEILSTPQIVEARKMWMQELQKQTTAKTDWYGGRIYHMKESLDVQQEDLFPGSPSYINSFRTFDFEPTKSSLSRYSDTERCPSISSGTQITGELAEETILETKDKDLQLCVSSKKPTQNFDNDDDDDDDDWPEEEDIDLPGYKAGVIPVGIEEDISFSDLEDDEDICMPINSKSGSHAHERKFS